MERDSTKKTNEKKRGSIVALIVLVIFIFIILNSDSDTTMSENSKNIHFCDASGCTDEGKYSINGTSGKEYYCKKHYKQMEEWADMITNY